MEAKLPDKEIANQLTESLKKAVGRQTSFEVSSPGLLLSGGLDSRIILGSAGQGLAYQVGQPPAMLKTQN